MRPPNFFLKEPDVKEKFREFFPKPPFRVEKEILARPLTKNRSLVGTAFDYLLRFYIEYSYDQTISTSWIAEIFLNILKVLIKREQDKQKSKNLKKFFKRVDRIIKDARRNHSQYLSNGQITEKLLESTISLAQLDIIYRTKGKYNSIGNIDKNDKKDLKKLISKVNLEDFKLKNICFLNPHFGKVSNLEPVADADLIIGDTLIDIKTIETLEMRRDTYNQLIFYFILNRLGGIKGMKEKIEIRKLGVYFSRYAYLHLYNIEDIIDESKLLKFFEWFKERATQ